ncbi:MAG: hypothetical protein H7Y60_00580 [Rhodospirillaceae bacterium]|nr:hypothetical protein [Rhodospirillales bacterium]
MRTQTLLLVLALSLAGCAQAPSQGCRVGFDIGSSGIRAGATTGDVQGRVSVDYLADVWADNVIDETVDATATALGELAPRHHDCTAVAGGYSAWRLAAEKGGSDKVADTLRDLQRRTGAYVFVIPQAVEGSYGYFAAKQQLGERLTTPFILDVGGGSLQFAAGHTGWGTALGQKAWRKLFCAQVKGSENPNCATNPVGARAAEQSAQVLSNELAQAKAALGTGFAVTAVSTPVVHGVHPILAYLSHDRNAIAGRVDATGFDRAALDSAIGLLADKDDAGIVQLLNGCRDGAGKPICADRFASTFVTDMLLVRSFMAGLQVTRMDVAEADITNVPGILADERAFAWIKAYPCYLARLRAQGMDAYTSDPRSCP